MLKRYLAAQTVVHCNTTPQTAPGAKVNAQQMKKTAPNWQRGQKPICATITTTSGPAIQPHANGNMTASTVKQTIIPCWTGMSRIAGERPEMSWFPIPNPNPIPIPIP